MLPPKKTWRFPSVEELSAKEILTLFTGRDAWHFPGLPDHGVPDLRVADCGHGVTLVAPPYGSATCLPTSVGMAASWNRDLIFEAGQLLGREIRAKSCGILLGPMVNLHRVPCGGRNYETFSEDPVLTGKMAASLVKGIQSVGSGACVKSFLANNQQREQKTASSNLDARTLEELHLKVYRVILDEVQPWLFMTSYNPANGEHPSDSAYWLEEVLRQKLGFEGAVVSDWNSVQGDTALTSGLDIEMPGPGDVLIPRKLQKALDEGLLDWNELKKRASRMLRLHELSEKARRSLDANIPLPELDSPRHRRIARKVAEESIVLLKNELRVLPLKRDQLQRLAVIGPNAATARLGGGGSASVSPPYAISPLQGIRNALPAEVEVIYQEGCSLEGEFSTIAPEAWKLGPEHDAPNGLKASYFGDGSEAPLATQIDWNLDFSWGWAPPATGMPRVQFRALWEGYLQFPTTGALELLLSTFEGTGRVWIDDQLMIDCWSGFQPDLFEDRYTNRSSSASLQAIQGETVKIRIEYQKTGTRAGIRLGWKVPNAMDSIEAAAELAASCDAAIVVGGISNMFEGGLNDRKQFELPGRQSTLITSVAASNPKTVVVLNNGSPVSFESWQDTVPAILEAFYPGQEGGSALASILFGDINPSGRLPDTMPRSWDQVLAMQAYQESSTSYEYREGLLVGYRDFDFRQNVPTYPFGFGLSYTKFRIGKPRLSSPSLTPDFMLTVTVDVENLGDREGKEVVQLYLEPIDPELPTPPASLIDFAKVSLSKQSRKTVSFVVPYREFLSYDPALKCWRLLTSRFFIRAGAHSRTGERIEVLVNEAPALIDG